MAKVHVRDSFDAPAEQVWGFFRDFGGVAKWPGSGVSSCSVEGEGIGAVRTLSLGRGNPIRERLVQFDDADRSFSYSILGPCDLPVSDYVGSVKLRAEGASRTTIDWIGTFDAKGAPEEAAQKIVEGIYRGGIAAVKKALGSR
jgi:carbon monoxide dehydrogenase subunit G